MQTLMNDIVSYTKNKIMDKSQIKHLFSFNKFSKRIKICFDLISLNYLPNDIKIIIIDYLIILKFVIFFEEFGETIHLTISTCNINKTSGLNDNATTITIRKLKMFTLSDCGINTISKLLFYANHLCDALEQYFKSYDSVFISRNKICCSLINIKQHKPQFLRFDNGLNERYQELISTEYHKEMIENDYTYMYFEYNKNGFMDIIYLTTEELLTINIETKIIFNLHTFLFI